MININKLEKQIFKIYLILLPFYTFNSFFTDIFRSFANSVAYVIQGIGVSILIFRYKKVNIKLNKFIRYFIGSIIVLNVSSFLMSIILYEELGVYLGKNTYTAIIPNILFYTQFIITIIYNYVSISRYKFIVVEESLEKIIKMVAIVGYIQLTILLTGNSFICMLYDKLNIFNLLRSSEYILKIDRISLTTFEPSTAGILMGILIIPYILSNIINKNRNKKIYFLYLIIYLPLIYYTHSSTAYLIFIVNIVMFLLLIFKGRKNKRNKIVIGGFIYLITIIALISILVFGNFKIDIDNPIISKIQYLLFEKITDEDNLSTIHRNTTIHNNNKIFEKYPLIGVGNGNQGFYYRINFPEWGYKSQESRDLLAGKNGFPGIASFLWDYISGYGILGIAILLVFSLMSYSRIKKFKNKTIKYLYSIGIIGFIVASTIATNISAVCYIQFIISLPSIDEKL